MLGIYLLVCMAVYFLIELKAYGLVKGGAPSVVLSAEPRTYEVCRQAVVLSVASRIVALVGYLGCAWPYLFIKDVSIWPYLTGVVMLGVFPMFLVIYSCYREIRYRMGTIQISTDNIEFNNDKYSTKIKVSDIQKITYPTLRCYEIHFKEKQNRYLRVDIDNLYKRKETISLMEQLSQYCAKACGKEKSIAYWYWRTEMLFGRYYLVLFKTVIGLLLA
jgi:hypothetical protein